VKIFITHGGLLSAQEAAYHGKTLIGIPIFGDQMLNMKSAQLGGYAVLLDFNNITKASVKWAINEALSNKRYSSHFFFNLNIR
jgi:glucuronosyltransferase